MLDGAFESMKQIDNDDNYQMKGLNNLATRFSGKPAKFVVSPPQMIQAGIGKFDISGLSNSQTQKTMLHSVIGKQRSPNQSFFKPLHADMSSIIKTKLQLNSKQAHPQAFKQLPTKKGHFGEAGIGLVESSGSHQTSQVLGATMHRNYGQKDANLEDSPSNRSFNRTNMEKAQFSDKFGIPGAVQSGFGNNLMITNISANKTSNLAQYADQQHASHHGTNRREKYSSLKHDHRNLSPPGIASNAIINEKTRLMDEIRQNRERAIQNAQLKKEAQLKRRKRDVADGSLNFSMRFEGTKDMAKFERHVQDVFSKKKAKKTNRNALSIDFSNIQMDNKIELQDNQSKLLQQNQNPDKLNQLNRTNRGSQLNILNQSSLLPKIDPAGGSGVSDVRASFLAQSIVHSSRRKKFAISSIDGSTMISRRERKFKYGNVEDKVKAFDLLAHSKENAGTYLLRSHHYKYNRIKEGGWGTHTSSNSSREDLVQPNQKTTLPVEALVIGSDGSSGSKNRVIDAPNLLNSQSNPNDQWSSAQFPKLNAAQTAEVNRLIKMENQRSSVAHSSINKQEQGHDEYLQKPISTIPSSNLQVSLNKTVTSLNALQMVEQQTQSMHQIAGNQTENQHQQPNNSVQRNKNGVGLAGREQSQTTLLTDYSTTKGHLKQMNLQNPLYNQSPQISMEERMKYKHITPDLVSARTKIPEITTEAGQPIGFGSQTQISVDERTSGLLNDNTKLYMSYDQGAFHALTQNSGYIPDPNRSQIFAMRAAITASVSQNISPANESNNLGQQHTSSTAHYPFINHHSILKATQKSSPSSKQQVTDSQNQLNSGLSQIAIQPAQQTVSISKEPIQKVREHMIEKYDRQAFNKKYQISDHSMSLLRGTRGLAPVPSATQQSIDLHSMNRRNREKIIQQINQLQQQLRQRKKQIQMLKHERHTKQQIFEEQVHINSKLDSIAVGDAQNDVDKHQYGSQSAADYYQYGQEYIAANSNSNSNRETFFENQDGRHIYVGSNNKQPLIDQFADHHIGFGPSLSMQQYQALSNAAQYDEINNQQHAKPSVSFKSQLTADKSIHDFYTYLFSADLKNSRDRTNQKLKAHGQWLQTNAFEIQQLIQDNLRQKSIITRYIKMIKEFKEEAANQVESQEIPLQNMMAASDVKKQIESGDIHKQVASLDHKTIAGELYKYDTAGHHQIDQLTQSKSDHAGQGHLTLNTPQTVTQQKTQMSFLGKSRANLIGHVVDKRKIDGTIILMNRVFKEVKALDSIVAHLSQLKNVFKAHKLTLFIIAPELQAKLFRNPKERRQNYKKILVNGGTISMSEQTVFAIYASEEDYCAPVFNDLDEAACHMFNNRTILIPLKKVDQVRMSLQIVCNPTVAQNTSKYRSNTNKVQRTSQIFEGHSFGHVTDRESASRGGASTRYNQIRGSTSHSEAKPRSLSAANRSLMSGRSKHTGRKKHTVSHGWTRNDFCLIKILSNFLSMNVDYFEQLVLQKAKVKKIDEIIDFAQDIITVKTYRQLVKKVQQYRQNVLGFDECALFFEDPETNDLFTLTNLEIEVEQFDQKKVQSQQNRQNTSFAKELLFPEDSIVVFPSTIGMTGEVYTRSGVRFKNDFGKASTQLQEVLDDAQSQKTSFSYNSTILNLFNSQAQGRVQATKLERIKEGNPQAEQEMDINSEQMAKSGSTQQGFNPFKVGPIVTSDERRISIERHGAAITGGFHEKTPTLREFQRNSTVRHESPLERVGLETKRHLDHSPSRRPIGLGFLDGDQEPTPFMATQRTSPMLDSQSFNEKIRNSEMSKHDKDTLPTQKSIISGKNNPKLKLHKKETTNFKLKKTSPLDTAPRYFADFLADIDNFLGVKDLDNFVISSIRDDGYSLGEKSVGVLHLFNKLDRTRINKDDLARIEQFSRLVGALAQKAHCITTSLSLIIGLSQNINFTTSTMGHLTISTGIGDFEQASAPVDTLRKQIGVEESLRRDIEANIIAQLKIEAQAKRTWHAIRQSYSGTMGSGPRGRY